MEEEMEEMEMGDVAAQWLWLRPRPQWMRKMRRIRLTFGAAAFSRFFPSFFFHFSFSILLTAVHLALQASHRFILELHRFLPLPRPASFHQLCPDFVIMSDMYGGHDGSYS